MSIEAFIRNEPGKGFHNLGRAYTGCLKKNETATLTYRNELYSESNDLIFT